MKKGLYLIVVWLVSVGAFAQAQDTLQTFERFFIDGMKKIDGVFPVYVSGKKVYLEIPRQYMEREVEVNAGIDRGFDRSEEHTSELQSRQYLVCRLLLEKKKNKTHTDHLSI